MPNLPIAPDLKPWLLGGFVVFVILAIYLVCQALKPTSSSTRTLESEPPIPELPQEASLSVGALVLTNRLDDLLPTHQQQLFGLAFAVAGHGPQGLLMHDYAGFDPEVHQAFCRHFSHVTKLPMEPTGKPLTVLQSPCVSDKGYAAHLSNRFYQLCLIEYGVFLRGVYEHAVKNCTTLPDFDDSLLPYLTDLTLSYREQQEQEDKFEAAHDELRHRVQTATQAQERTWLIHLVYALCGFGPAGTAARNCAQRNDRHNEWISFRSTIGHVLDISPYYQSSDSYVIEDVTLPDDEHLLRSLGYYAPFIYGSYTCLNQEVIEQIPAVQDVKPQQIHDTLHRLVGVHNSCLGART